MKKLTMLPLFALLTLPALANSSLVRSQTCAPQVPGEHVIHNEDFLWGETLPQILKRAQDLYIVDKRLDQRAYINAEGQVVLPMDVFNVGIKEVKLSPTFIKSVRLHIEQALKRRYVDAIIFSDMGHSHFFIPQDYYRNELRDIPIHENHIMYEKMLSYEGLKVLYHTGEQLQMKDESGTLLPDRHIQWRFFTRNLVGDNKAQGHLELIHAEDHAYNTAHEYEEGYKYWGAGFYISANKNGCFPFTHKGETFYFGLNLFGFEPK